MNIYQYNDYLAYIQKSLEQNKQKRGFHAQMAKAAGMHPSYLSRILHEFTHITPDQAAGLSQFWKFDREETNYFLALVNWARAGTPALKNILEKELEIIKSKQLELGPHLHAENIGIDAENLYYSSWYYCAVHILITIPECNTESAISEKLGLKKEQIKKILKTLEQLGFVKKDKGKWLPLKTSIHLSNKSWMAAIHHINWRIKMADQIQFRHEEELHYTGIHTLGKTDFKKIKDKLLEVLVEVNNIVRPSPEEELCCLLIDWSKF
jgi:uncharacterized protein (TIGR02147 family)